MHRDSATESGHNREHYKTLDINTVIQKLLKQPISQSQQQTFILSEWEVSALCYRARNIFLKQPMLLELNPPIKICGDIHGQFQDLKHIFEEQGDPSVQNYLFLGDYVDRGKRSLQSICLLLAYKILYPQNFYMLRGNHECSQVNKIYGFYNQCKNRLNIKSWKTFTLMFNFFPSAAIVGERIFCVHGGLSPQLLDASNINSIFRPCQFEKQTLLCDLLWADPGENVKGFTFNHQRGVSHLFGRNAVQKFLQFNDFDLICRSHQVVQSGYEFMFDRKILTVFSAPNYCGMYDNIGALLIVDQKMNCQIKIIDSKVLLKRKQLIEYKREISTKSRKPTVSPYPKLKQSSPKKNIGIQDLMSAQKNQQSLY